MLDSGLASGSFLAVSLLNIWTIIIRSYHPSRVTWFYIPRRTLVDGSSTPSDVLRTILCVRYGYQTPRHLRLQRVLLIHFSVAENLPLQLVMNVYNILIPT
ncbi:uncharacterized protein BJ212DRAFT_1401176, partial [Suillus subaureus]